MVNDRNTGSFFVFRIGTALWQLWYWPLQEQIVSSDWLITILCSWIFSSLMRVIEINPIYLIIAAVKGPQAFGMSQLMPKQIPDWGFAAISQATPVSLLWSIRDVISYVCWLYIKFVRWNITAFFLNFYSSKGHM